MRAIIGRMPFFQYFCAMIDQRVITIERQQHYEPGVNADASASDERFMRRALQLAAQGWGHTSPNPMVGAVIVCHGRIIGEGFHRRCGQAHAEVNAIESVSPDNVPLLSESTIYVSLEPCSHYGKTPPCAELLVERRLKRVVVGTLDPFVKVSGRGVAMLRQAGIDVTVGVLERECRQLNERFFTAHTNGRPWIQLKWAQSADGFLATADGRCLFSTPLTTALMHRERAHADAILIGAGTAAADNPSLTTRHWPGNTPTRVLLDRRLSTPHTAHLLSDGRPTVVYNAMKDVTEGSVTYVKIDCDNLDAILHDLYLRGFTSLMVEGGPHILRQFLNRDLWDQQRIETAPFPLHTGLPL